MSAEWARTHGGLRRGALALGASVLLAVVALYGSGLSGASSARGAAKKPATPVTVQLTIRGGQGKPSGAVPLIKVKVGNGPTVPVVLDSGSVGLHIYAPGVNTGRGGGVTQTNLRNSISYVDGTLQTGVVATAKLTIGGVMTSKAIPFGLITKVSCVAAKPNCPTANGIKAVVKHGTYGIMGVRFESVKSGLPPSPLVNLPQPYGTSWSIALSKSGGKLVLGAKSPSKPAAVLKLTSGSVPKTIVCWTIGSASNICEPTLFDSGDYGMQVYGGPLAQAPTVPGTTRVQSGTPVSASVPGAPAPFWSFSAGQAPSSNTVNVHPPGRSGNAVNAAVQAFFAFTLTWNTQRRTIELSASS
jgi:hypothetical protein